MIVNYDPVLQALLASLFTWGVTALGAALVFVLPTNSKKFLDVSLGFAGGVMTAASFWSLLAPAIEISEQTMGSLAFIPVAVGFALGALFVHLSDNLIPSCVVAEMSIISVLTKECQHLDSHSFAASDHRLGKRKKEDSNAVLLLEPQASRNSSASLNSAQASGETGPAMGNGSTVLELSALGEEGSSAEKEGLEENARPPSPSNSSSELMLSWRRILLLIMAVTVHNIPEGLAVGVGFGSVGKAPGATFEKAFNLALGIGLQNFPEGLAVSLPLASFGYSKFKAFMYGQLSGMVEPFAALLGAAAVILMEPVLPYALSFAAGAMIYVVFDDIIPEAQRNGNGKLASAGTIVGFLVMMCMASYRGKESEMFITRVSCAVRRFYTEVDFARHMPKAYVNRAKRTIPRKIYDNRLGAPQVIKYRRPPEDCVPTVHRPWTQEAVNDALDRENQHFRQWLNKKYFKLKKSSIKPIPAEEWTIYPGDLVQVMIGEDKNKQGIVSHVMREANAVFVDGLHTKLQDLVKDHERFGLDKVMSKEPEPLYVDKGQVMLVDPNDNEPCSAKWILNENKTDYIRISERTMYEIPLPAQAHVTYEYISAENYIEVEGKDTKASDVLKRTYRPKLCTFEQEIMEEYGIKEDKERKPTFWY